DGSDVPVEEPSTASEADIPRLYSTTSSAISRKSRAEIGCALPKLVEQPRVLDGDDGLGGEGPKKRYLLIRKRINFGTSKLECSDHHPLMQQWNTSDRSVSELPRQGASFGKVLGLRLEVNYMNGLPLENDAACNSSTRARETKAPSPVWEGAPVGGFA